MVSFNHIKGAPIDADSLNLVLDEFSDDYINATLSMTLERRKLRLAALWDIKPGEIIYAHAETVDLHDTDFSAGSNLMHWRDRMKAFLRLMTHTEYTTPPRSVTPVERPKRPRRTELEGPFSHASCVLVHTGQCHSASPGEAQEAQR